MPIEIINFGTTCWNWFWWFFRYRALSDCYHIYIRNIFRFIYSRRVRRTDGFDHFMYVMVLMAGVHVLYINMNMHFLYYRIRVAGKSEIDDQYFIYKLQTSNQQYVVYILWWFATGLALLLLVKTVIVIVGALK